MVLYSFFLSGAFAAGRTPWGTESTGKRDNCSSVPTAVEAMGPRPALKMELPALADDTGLGVRVCHLPPGASKRNKIEYRLLSHIQ
jgi:hypothetical protein